MREHALSILLALCAACAAPSGSEVRDSDVQLYVHADIVTMDPARPRAEAMAVRDGVLIAVGDEASVRAAAGSDYEVYDLDGAAVTPGFIESHEHMVMHGGILSWANLTPAQVSSRDDIIERLKRQPPAEDGWILGWGVEPLLLQGEDQRDTWRKELDAAFPDTPVFLLHCSGHGAFVNSKVFELAGITPETEAPPGSSFTLDENGDLEGYIAGRPAWLMVRGFPEVTPETTRESARTRAEVGITTTTELAIIRPQLLDLIEEVTSEPDFPVRLVGGLFITMPGIDEVAARARNYETDLFKVRFIKSWADGSIQGGTAAFRDGYYAMKPASESGLTMSQAEFDAQVTKMYELGYWPALHANGDAAMDMALHAIEAAQQATGRTDLRPQLIHCQLVQPDQFERVTRLGATMTFFTTHIYNYGDLHLDMFLGPERGSRISPIKTAFDLGIPAAMHDDAPVAMPNPLFNMWAAVNRKTRSGRELDQDLCLTPEQALAAYTRNAAYELGLENEVGTLEAGKRADFVVLSENPLEIDRDRIKDVTVEATVMNGRLTHLADEFYTGSL